MTSASWCVVVGDGARADQAEDEGEGGGVLGQFVDYITSLKTVPLEQLAAEFRMRTTEVIDRIRTLEDAGRLTGVMDERGKVRWRTMCAEGSPLHLKCVGQARVTNLTCVCGATCSLLPPPAVHLH